MINCHGRTSTKDPMGAYWPSCIPHMLHLHGWKHSAISVQQEGSSSVQPWSYRKEEEVWALFRGSCGESCAHRHPSRLGKETSLIYLLRVIRQMPAEVSSLLWKEIWKMQPLFLQNKICALITILCTEAHMPVQSKDPYVCAPLPAQLLISWVSGGDFPTLICMLHDFFHLEKEDDDSSSMLQTVWLATYTAFYLENRIVSSLSKKSLNCYLRKPYTPWKFWLQCPIEQRSYGLFPEVLVPWHLLW